MLIMSRIPRASGLLAAALLCVLVPAAAAADTLSVNEVTFAANQLPTPCPPGVPTTGGGCASTSASARVRGLGATQFADTVELLNGPQSLSVSGTLTVPAKGTMSFSGTGDGRSVTFDVTAGTGAYAGASGKGTLSPALSQTGAAKFEFQLSGTFAAPGATFDTTPPTLRITGAKAVRKGTQARVTIGYRAADEPSNSLAYSLVLGAGKAKIHRSGPAGSRFQLFVPAARKAKFATGTLTVSDDSANTTVRRIRIRLVR
jgi:hypothetical protein